METHSGGGPGPARGVLIAVLVGLSLVASAFIWSATFYRVKALENTLGVTGSAKRRITSDAAKWTASFSRSAVQSGFPNANAALQRDREAVLRFFESHAVPAESLMLSPVMVDPIYRGSDSGPQEFSLRQTVQFQSRDVAAVTALARDSSTLIDQGLLFSTQGLEYTYTRLGELRVQMLAGAIQDARARAEAIAASSGGRLGRLKSATAGVIQVVQVNSTEVSDYGAYDTSTIEKDVIATVRASFTLR